MDNGASSYRRFLDGDESAFDEIMNELFRSLVFFIDRYVHDIQTAEDIAIDAFSDLIVHKHRYNFKVTLKTYLFMIGRSRALDYIKHRKIIEFVPLNEVCNTGFEEKQLEEIILTDERKQYLNSAISKLSIDMRVAVHLVYFEDMTYSQTAKIMKKSVKQVDNLLYRAKKELRIILGEDGEQLL
ncbi:MAG: RNA polymerase sigma factor [Clostridia bacterium]|nr:RNA polymerase sigma factor [Clostridia bacterium]